MMKIKRCILFLAVLTMLFAFAGVVSAADGDTINSTGLGGINASVTSYTPSATTIYTYFKDIPMVALFFNNSNTTNPVIKLSNITISPLYTGVGAASDYALAFYNDSNRNGVVDYGDTVILGYTTLTAAYGAEQIFTLSAEVSIAGGNANSNITVLVLAKNVTSNPTNQDSLTLNVSRVYFRTGNNVTNSTVTNNVTGRTLAAAQRGNNFTISTTQPVLTVAVGGKSPAARSIKNDTTNEVVLQLNFSESAGVTQTVSSINLTPVGTLRPKADVNNIKFYIDENNDGAVQSTDKQLIINTTGGFVTDFTSDTLNGGQQNITINGSLVIPASSFKTLLVVFDMNGSGPTPYLSFKVNITAATAVVLGTDLFIAAAGTYPLGSNNFTIDMFQPNMTKVELFDMNGDGYLDAMNVTFNETVYLRSLANSTNVDQWNTTTFNITSSTNHFMNWSYYTGNRTANNGSTVLTFIFNTSKQFYDTGDYFLVSYNKTGINISDDAGNEIEDNFGANITFDLARPIIVSARTFDYDADGYIDGYNITFSEAVNYSTLVNYTASDKMAQAWAATNFTVSGYSSPMINISNVSLGSTAGLNCTVDYALNNSICLWFTESSAPDTGAVPDLTVVVNTIADNASASGRSGNVPNWMNAVTTGTIVEQDKAAPVLMSAYTGSYRHAGIVDYVNFSFSEPMNFSTFYNFSNTTGITLRFENDTVLSGVKGAGITIISLDFQFITDIGDSANSRNLYINFSGFSEPMKLNTSHRFEFNLTSALWDMNQTNMSKNVNAFSNLYITNDTVAPYVRHRYGCGYNSSGIPNQGYAINTTGCIVLEFTEPINHTLSNASVAANNASITFTVKSNEALLINILNLSPSAAMSQANVTIWINVTDRANSTVGFANRRNVTTSIRIDATPPTITWVALNTSNATFSEGYIQDTDAINDTLLLYFSENMTRADKDATSAADLLFKISDDAYTAWSAEAVETYTGDGSANNSRIIIVRLGGAVDVNARGIWNGSNSSGGADAVLLQPFSRAVTDLAGNNPSNSTGKLDIADAVVTFTPNQWTGFSVPYSLNSTMLDTRLSGLTTSIYTYNGTHWVARTTSQLTQLEGYLVRINTTSLNHVPINLLSIDTNNPVTPSSITLNNGWNLIAVDGKNGSTNTTEGRLCNVTSSSSWLNSVCTGTPVVQGAYVYEVGAGNSLIAKAVNSENIPALYVVPYNSYWVNIRSTTSAATASFSGFGRW